MTKRRVFLAGAAALVGLVCLNVASQFRRAISHAAKKAQSNSQVFKTKFGDMEYAIRGEGAPIVMIHGTGGGYDQGLYFAKLLIERGYKVIAPSRFGYLRTDFPANPTSENQADAVVELLDHLGVARATIIGGSAGALSALQVAIRHPTRCAALVAIVPATFVPSRNPVRPSALGAAIMKYALRSDFIFWLGINLAEDMMISTLLATDPNLVKAAPKEEQQRVREILNGILPVSAKYRGLLNDAELAGTPQPMDLASIKVPTLAISLEDDRFGTFAAAQHIATSVPGAKLISFPTGGHVYVGHEVEIFAGIDKFLSSALS